MARNSTAARLLTPSLLALALSAGLVCAAPSQWDLRRDGLDGFPELRFQAAAGPTADLAARAKLDADLEAVRERLARLQRAGDWQALHAFAEEQLRRRPDHPATTAALEGFARWLSPMTRDCPAGRAACLQLLKRHPVDPVSAFRVVYLLTRSYLYPLGPPRASHEAGRKPTVTFSAGRRRQIEVAVYRVDLFGLLRRGASPQSPGYEAGGVLVKRWTQATKWVDNDVEPAMGEDAELVEPEPEEVEIVESAPGGIVVDDLVLVPKAAMTEKVELPVTGPGAYLVTLGTEHYEWRQVVLLSRLAVTTRGDGRILLVQASDTDGKGPGACELAVFQGGRRVYRGRTADDGLFVGRVIGSASDASVVVRRGDDWAVCEARAHGPGHSDPQPTLHVYTDRPVYRPKQTVHLKAIVRRFDVNAERWLCKPGDAVRALVRGPRGKTILDKSAQTSDFGTAAFSAALGEEPALGWYRVAVSAAHHSATARFKVEEYRKPEVVVGVSFDRPYAFLGERLWATVSARHYFGKPVAAGRVSCAARACEADPRPGARSRRDAWYSHKPEKHYYDSGRLVAQGQGELRGDGTYRLPIDTAALAGETHRPLELVVAASVIDASRRRTKGFGLLRLVPAAVVLSAYTARHDGPVGQRVPVHIRTTDLDGRGVAAAVDIEVATPGEEAAEPAAPARTNAAGHGLWVYVPDRLGAHTVTLRTRDAEGREARATLIIAGARVGRPANDRSRGVTVRADAALYRPGDTARVSVETAQLGRPVLVTVEGRGIEAYRLARVEGGPLAFEQPLAPWCAPQLWLRAGLFDGRSWTAHEQRVTVAPTHRWLRVGIAPDRPRYKPGQNAAYTITLADHYDRPVAGEVSLAVVDEALYAVEPDRTPDIRKTFLGSRRRHAESRVSADLRSLALGSPRHRTLACGDIGPDALFSGLNPPAGYEARFLGRSSYGRGLAIGGRGGALPWVRRRFADVAAWWPALRTDQYGQVRVAFTMPDNLTTWRAGAVAVTRNGLVGQTTRTVRTEIPFLVRLECPRTLTEGDEVTVSGIVHNYLPEAKRATVELDAEGARLMDGPRRVEVDVPSRAVRRIDWRLRVSGHQTVTLRATARAGEESDAMELEVPVVPRGMLVASGRSGSVSDAVAIPIRIPREADPAKSRLRVTLCPTVGSALFDGLDYLVGYPYGCVEQTMSRFLPAVVVAQVLERVGARDPALTAKLPHCVSRGLERLYRFQHADRGWGWWEKDETNPFMTAYVVAGLARAQRAGFPVRRSALARGAQWLADRAPGEPDLNLRAYMLFALAQVQRPEDASLDALYERRGELSGYATALLMLACKQAGQTERVRELLAALAGRAEVRDDACCWHSPGLRNVTTVEATAYVLLAIVAVEPRHPLAAKAAHWLLRQREGGRWSSTKDSAAALLALAEHLAATGQLQPDYEATAWLNATRVRRLRVHADADGVKPIVLDFGPEQFKLSGNVVRLRVTGKGTLHYTCRLEYYTRGAQVEAMSAGLTVARAYALVVPTNGKDAEAYRRQPLGDTVRSGDEIEVRLVVETDRPRDYLMLEDYFPAGCEVIADKADLPARLRDPQRFCSHREARDERIAFFKTHLPRGKHVFVYTLRAETPGRFHAMPARAELMYQPDVRGNSAEARLTIVDR